MIIKVDPSLLHSNANQIQGISGDISSRISGAVSAAESAPSYDGQFGPKVAAIGAETGARAGNLSSILESLGVRLGVKATDFENVDNAGISGFNSFPHTEINWLESFLFPNSGGGTLSSAQRYLSLGNLLNGNGANLSLGALFAMIFGSGQMWNGWTFSGIAQPSWWPSWLPWLSQEPARIVSPIPEDNPPPKTTFGDLLKETPTASPSAQANTAPTPASTTGSYDVYYNVPTEAQGTLNNDRGCSATAVSMLVDYYHAQNGTYAAATPQQIQAPLGNSGTNISMSDTSSELAKLGYKASWTFNGDPPGKTVTMSDLQSALKDGPVAVVAKVKLVGSSDGTGTIDGPGSYSHALVVKGYGKDTVVVNDPWSGKELQIPDATFSQMWSGGSNAIFVVRPS